MSDLRDWLRGNKFEQYADAFEANDIDLDVLPIGSRPNLDWSENSCPYKFSHGAF